MANDLTNDIVDNAQSPQSITTDGTTTTSQSIADQIAADRYVNNKAAMRNRSRGIRFSKLILGGQVSGVPGPFGGFNGFV